MARSPNRPTSGRPWPRASLGNEIEVAGTHPDLGRGASLQFTCIPDIEATCALQHVFVERAGKLFRARLPVWLFTRGASRSAAPASAIVWALESKLLPDLDVLSQVVCADVCR